MERAPNEFSLVQELDQLFGKYYASKDRTDYFDGSGKGKFWSLCEDYGQAHDSALKQFIAADYIYDHFLADNAFSRDFPCFSRPPFSESGPYSGEQLCLLFDQLYEQRRVPWDKELCMKLIPEFMSWFHIAESVKHEMSTGISIKMKEVFDDWKSSRPSKLNDFTPDAMEKFIADLQEKRKLNNKEVEFIRSAVERARHFEAGKDIEAMSFVAFFFYREDTR